MIYATYEYYTDDYFGNAITEQEFPKYARRASAEIDHVTFGRLSKLSEDAISDVVRDCMCDVAERMHYFETAKGSDLASENNDGYSVSYRDTGNTDTQKHEIHATIRTYLAVTGLMFRGISKDDLCDA